MKKMSILLALAVLLTGGALALTTSVSQAQVYGPGPPPAAPAMTPWVGQGTPWTYYNGDWFNNGILHYFFGPKYGWAPYYAYPRTYVARPGHWYGPKWNMWYRTHPVYYRNFEKAHPYWRGHRAGHSYDEGFYKRHHHGHGKGWQKGYYVVQP